MSIFNYFDGVNMSIIKKIWLFIKSIILFVFFKIKYKSYFSISMINSIKGILRVELQKNAKVDIGKFLMTRGPFYIKCINDAELKIGERCFFNHNCSITCAEKILIGNHCMFANNLVIIDHDHKIENGIVSGKLVSEPILIGDYVWCGANVTILKGVKIGDGAVIAAGAVINHDVPSHTMVAGVPARIIKNTLS